MALNYIKERTVGKFSRRDMLIVFVTILAILVSFFYPQKTYGETFWLSFFLFALFPAIAAGYFLKEPLRNFGLSLGKPRTGAIISLIVLIIFIAANYLLVYHSKYAGTLSIYPFIIGSFTAFMAFEVFIVLPLHFFWEFFFRGFVQMGLENRLGAYSLILAAILQTALSFRSSWIAILLVFFSSLAAGLIVRQSRSIVYSAIALWIISVSLDIMIIRIVHQVAK